MSFFKKERSGPSIGGDAKKGCGIAGADNGSEIVNVTWKLDGAGPQTGYEQNVVKRSGSKL